MAAAEAFCYAGFVVSSHPPTKLEKSPMKILKTLLLLVILGITVAAVSACRQTMKGAGEDIEDAGQSIQRSAN